MKNNLHWISFGLEDGNVRWFCTDLTSKFKMENVFRLVVMRYLRTKKKYGFLIIIT